MCDLKKLKSMKHIQIKAFIETYFLLDEDKINFKSQL